MEYEITDAEINRLATDDWTATLASLWVAAGKPLEKERLVFYKKSLSSVPLGLLELAIDRAVKGYAYAGVVPLHNVWEAIRQELHNPPEIPAAIEQWCEMKYQSILIRRRND